MTPILGKSKKSAPRPKNGKKPPLPQGEPDRKRLILLFLIPLAIFLILQVFVFPGFELKEVSYSEFYRMLTRNPETGEISRWFGSDSNPATIERDARTSSATDCATSSGISSTPGSKEPIHRR